MTDTRTLGTLLRHLIELLDGGVEETYRGAGLDYRPRYTPVVRVLLERGPASIRTISDRAGMTHSAVSQTISHMTRAGLITMASGADARERVATLSPAAVAMIPALKQHWAATEAAVRALEHEIGTPLAEVAQTAIKALERRPLADRIREHGDETS